MHPGDRVLVLALLLLFLPSLALAQPSEVKPQALDGVDLIEHLGDSVDPALTFTDSSGRPVRLGDYLDRGRPVILTLVYYDCPMLCGLLLSGLVASLQKTGLTLGKDYDVVTVSFNPREKPPLAAEKQGHYLQALNRPDGAAHWPFLVGEDPAIRALADRVGLQYKYVESAKQYAHIAALTVLTPQGKISRYLYGVQFPPRDLRLAVVEAADGRVGSSFDRFLLTCFKYDPARRRYAFIISGVIQGGGLAVFGALTGLLVVLWRRERRKRGASG